MNKQYFLTFLFFVLVFGSSCVIVSINAFVPTQEVEKPDIVPHSEWEKESPVGNEADAVRRNIAPGEKIEFKDLSLTLKDMKSLSADGKETDQVVLKLSLGDDREQITRDEGEAFNWKGYHIAILAVHTRDDELGAGLTEFEIATIDSLPDHIAKSTEAGDAMNRLRIPHQITMITLHHSGSAKPVTIEDDIPQKLRNLQAWGQRDKNWWDIPYHYVIGPDGTIYEGRDHRFVGETNTRYDPTGHFLICVIGNYEIQEPTQEQIQAVKALMVWAAQEYGIPSDEIYGHSDLADTACPGKYLRKYLENGTFSRSVQNRTVCPD